MRDLNARRRSSRFCGDVEEWWDWSPALGLRGNSLEGVWVRGGMRRREDGWGMLKCWKGGVVVREATRSRIAHGRIYGEIADAGSCVLLRWGRKGFCKRQGCWRIVESLLH
jgi:hypothetical protein